MADYDSFVLYNYRPAKCDIIYANGILENALSHVRRHEQNLSIFFRAHTHCEQRGIYLLSCTGD